MLSRLRRPAALLVPALVLSLAACGGGDDGPETAKGFDAVEVSGEPGSTPEVDWKAVLEPGKAETEVTEGDGKELKKGNDVLVNLYIGNGYTHETNIDTFGTEEAGFVLKVGGEPAQPATAGDLLTALVAEQVEPGMTLGTRIAMTFGVEDQFPEYATALAELGIGNQDGLLLVADLIAVPGKAPDGRTVEPAAWAPEVIETKGEPTGLDFSGTPAPDKKPHVVTLVEGKGPKVRQGDAVVVDYLGQVYDAESPFDDSYSKDQRLTAAIGKEVTPISSTASTVVRGWNSLVGVPVGSRVIISIPPQLGYGKQGNPQAGIKGTDTMFFIVDVHGAA